MPGQWVFKDGDHVMLRRGNVDKTGVVYGNPGDSVYMRVKNDITGKLVNWPQDQVLPYQPEPVFDSDGLVPKYVVFRHPGRPMEMVSAKAAFHIPPFVAGDEQSLEYVEDDFLFVLKPETDPHARVAIAAYAESVRREKPQLSQDLKSALELLEEE